MLYFLFVWITWAKQREGDGGGWDERRDLHALLSCRLLPWHLCAIIGGYLGLSSRERKGGGISALAVCKTTQDGSLGLGLEARSSLGPSS